MTGTFTPTDTSDTSEIEDPSSLCRNVSQILKKMPYLATSKDPSKFPGAMDPDEDYFQNLVRSSNVHRYVHLW